MPNTAFSENIKRLRIEAGLTQVELAKELSVSRGSISYYENAERTPDVTFLASAATYFDCSTDYLLGKSDTKRPVLPNAYTFNEYQAAAQRTANPALTKEQKLYNSIYGLVGEAGELLDLIKKRDYQGHSIPLQKIQHEAGDILWYLAELSAATDTSIEMLASMNIEKLRERYPEGFSAERSINRGA